jgi:hypothetical protein
MENVKQGNLSLAEKFNGLLTSFVAQLQTKKFWIELFIMTAGMFVASIAVYFFLIPSKLIVGSITGLSIVVAKLFPILSVGTYIAIINAILLVLAFVLIGNEFGAKTVYTALILGPMIDFLGAMFPGMAERSVFAVQIGQTAQWIANPWFDLLCFVLVLSASQSILFSINASTGGLDILAKIINKYTHVSLGTSVAIGGGAICCTAFAINPVGLVLIGLIGTWVNGLIVNYFMANLNAKTLVNIITDDYEKIVDFVSKDIKRGITMRNVTGGYSKEAKVELEVVLTQDEFSSLIDFMHKEHIKSFMTSYVVSSVYGLWNKKSLLKLSDH